MIEWWRTFVHMPDAERAKVLGLVAMGAIIGLLYALGGLSLYLRAHYLGPTSPGPRSTVTPMSGPTKARETETPTLFPTLTPSPAQALMIGTGSATTLARHSAGKANLKRGNRGLALDPRPFGGRSVAGTEEFQEKGDTWTL